MSHYPVLLSTATKQCGLVTGTLLAVGTKDEILVYDLETGSILHSINARPILDDSTSDWILSTNSKFSTITIMHLTEGTVTASFSVVSLEGSKLPSSGLSLASKLASSCLTSLHMDEKPNANSSGVMIINDLIMAEDVLDSERPSAELEDAVTKALEAFDEARVKVMATNDGKGDCIFLETYESCISSLIGKMKVSDTLNGIAPDHNPQDALPSNGKLLNGKKKKSPSKSRIEKDSNGVNSHSMKPRGLTPNSLSQAFIDGALQIVLSLLHCDEIEGRRATFAQVNARLILSQLIKTGKVSARLHFENTAAFQETSKEHILEATLRNIELSNKRGQRVYSPVDMILGMLRWCPDLSERQLVAMLNYMLRRSLPDDVAEALKESKLSIQHPYMKICQRYFSLRDQYLKQSSREENDEMPKDLEAISHKLVTAGTTFVLQKIICYTECNDAMLRAALAEGISNYQSSIILAKMLSNLILSSKDIAKGNYFNHNKVKTTCQWISALCESFQDELSEATTPSGDSFLKFILQCVKSATRHSQAIISLNEDLTRNSLQKDSIANKPGLKSAPVTRDEELPGYSIDQLVI